MNAKYIELPFFKKNTIVVIMRIMESGSVIPSNELLIIRPSKITILAPISEMFLGKKFLYRKYAGMKVMMEIVMLIKRVNKTY